MVLGAGAEVARRTALEGAPVAGLYVYPFPLWKFPNGVCLGWFSRMPNDRGQGFPAIVQDWLREAEPETVLVTGTELANDLFLDLVRRQGYSVTVAIVDSGRPEEHDTRAFAERHVEAPWWIDGLEPVHVVAARLRLHPVVETLRRPCLRCQGRDARREKAPQAPPRA